MSTPDTEIDDLFGDGSGTPSPSTTGPLVLSLLGLFMSLCGMACLAAPGGIPVLLALWWIERERDRVNNGYLPADAGPVVERTRRLVYLALFAVIGLFVIQALLYCNGTYDALGNLIFLGAAPDLF